MEKHTKFSKLSHNIRCKLNKMCDINSQLQEIIDRLEDPSTDKEREELLECREYLERQMIKVSNYINRE